MSSRGPIMLVTNYLSGGGAERAVVMIANSLADAGERVVLVPVRAGEPDLVAARVDVEPLGKRPGSELAGLPSTLARFDRLVRRVRPSILHAHCELPELLAAFARTVAPVVITEHTREPWQKWPRTGAAVRQILIARRARWIVPQPSMSPWRVPAPSVVIPNPVLAPTTHWRPRQNSAGLRIATVSRLVPLKRADWILRAAAEVQKPVGVDVVGEGEARGALEDLAGNLGLDAVFHGHLVDPWKVATNADVFVTASSTEADPVALGEALAVGIPVLASDIQAHRDQGVPRAQLFADPSELAQKLQTLRSGTLCLDSKERAALRDQFLRARGQDIVAAAHLSVYRGGV